MAYSEKLKDPRWQRKRLEVMQRDNFTCTNCGSSTKNLQIHHLDYEPGVEPWEYPKEQLKTLCNDCHAKEQGREKHEEMLIQSLRISGFHVDDVVKLATYLHFESFRKWIKDGLKSIKL